MSDTSIYVRIKTEDKERVERIIEELLKRYPDGMFSMASFARQAIMERADKLEKELSIE